MTHIPIETLFVAALLGSGATVGLIRQLAPKLGWICQPRADRWHRKPTALMGGLGFIPWVLGAGLVWVMGCGFNAEHALKDPTQILRGTVVAWSLLAGALLLFLTGWIDDRTELRPRTKLAMQLLASGQLIYFGGGLNVTGWAWLDGALSFLWLLGVTNAVNLLDNLDGLCAGVCAISAGCLCLLPAEWSVRPGPGLALLVMAGCLGFLIHNRPPAGVFMGDVGSLPLGFLLAGLAVPGPMNSAFGLGTNSQGAGGVSFLLVPATLMAVPVFDTALVFLTRIWESRNPMKGGKDHSSHRLALLLASIPRTLAFFYGTALLAGGAVAYAALHRPALLLPVTGLIWVALFLVGVFLAQPTQSGLRTPAPPQLLRAVTRLLDSYNLLPLLLDAVLILILLPLALALRFEFQPGVLESAAVGRAFPLLLTACLGTGLLLGIYAHRWGTFSLLDLGRHVAAVIFALALVLAGLTLFSRFGDGHSRSVYLIFGLLYLGAQILSRKFLDVAGLWVQVASRRQEHRQPVLIYGAGKRGRLLVEACHQVPELRDYRPMGFLDDADNLHGKRLCGLKILSPRKAEAFFRKGVPDNLEIWISGEQIQVSAAQLPRHLRGRKIRRLILRLEED